MSKLFSILFVLFSSSVYAQQSNSIAFANTFTFDKKEGFDESNYYVIGNSEDGRTFFHSHGGSLFIKGNNYVTKIRFPSGGLSDHIKTILFKNENDFFAFGDDKYYHICDDSIVNVYEYPDFVFEHAVFGNNVIGCNKDLLNSIWVFKKDSFVCELKSHFTDGVIFIGSDGNFWEVVQNGNKLSCFQANDTNRPVYKFSVYVDEKNIRLIDSIMIRGEGITLYSPLNYTAVGTYKSSKILDFRKNAFFETGNETYEITNDNNSKLNIRIRYPDKLMNGVYNKNAGAYYAGTFNKPIISFTYLHKYPTVFINNSSSIYSIAQDFIGRIWVGSYKGELSVIDTNRVAPYRKDYFLFLPGNYVSKKYVYLNTEREERGLIRFDLKNKAKVVDVRGHFISTFYSKRTGYLYLGSASFGLFKIKADQLEKEKSDWEDIDSTLGNKIYNSISTITEDTLGRIWMGARLRGFGIYYPHKNIAKTWLISKGETDFGFWSSLTDSQGTVWLGSDNNGLMYYKNYADEIRPGNIKTIGHPLLPAGTKVMQLLQWRKWLIISTGKDILVMDLAEWHRSGKVQIRYLNPLAANFSAEPEQNTILLDKRDSSVWFATGNMLYQWNLKQWFSLPIFIVQPQILVETNGKKTKLSEGEKIFLKPTQNTLKIMVRYQTPDNLPRYLRIGLARKGDVVDLGAASLQSEYIFQNLASGKYTLVLQILQADGSIKTYKYPINIDIFWWQKWWVWVLLSFIVISPFLIWIINKNKIKLAEEKAKLQSAELKTMYETYQKELNALQVMALGNQFRPHFILNALNTIGAELNKWPQAETVLSKLGESINIIFEHARNQKIVHPLPEEWKLVKNIIEINKLMYLKKLEVILPAKAELDKHNLLLVPLGLLQVPIENSLLHGLCNRLEGPWKLEVLFKETGAFLSVIITDNGVGRKKAESLSNYQKHGTGMKNIVNILNVLNKGKKDKIKIQFTDEIFGINGVAFGTRLEITIPKNNRYET